MIRRACDALLLLIVASNTYHLVNAAARLWMSRSGPKHFDAGALFAQLDGGISRDTRAH